MRSIVTFAICFSLFTVPYVQAQEAQAVCSNLLRHGIYDHFRESGDSFSNTAIRNEICESYNQLKSVNQGGNVDVSYKVKVFNGSASFSKDELEVIGRQMCELDSSHVTATNAVEKASSKINVAAVDAWRGCVDSYSRGLRAETVYTEDDTGVKAITLTLSYVNNPGATGIKIDGVDMSADDAFSCSGRLWDAAQAQNGTVMGTNAYTMVCRRNISPQPFTEQGRTLFARVASLTVSTNAGSVTRQVLPIIHTPPPLTETKVMSSEIITIKDSGRWEWTVGDNSKTRVVAAWYTVENQIDQLPRFKSIIVNTNREKPGIVEVIWQRDKLDLAALAAIRLHAVYMTR